MRFLKKSLGQNFLIDKNVINKITHLTDIKNKNIIEIGPGNGALTENLLNQNPKTLNLIEKDNFFAEKLKKIYSSSKIVKIYNLDVLKFNIERIIKKNTVIFGNLPYNISSQILVKILRIKNQPTKYKNIIFMFQKELGEKISSTFPNKNYGRLSILSNYKLDIHKKFIVSPYCFFPKPKVTSMVIHFKSKKKELFRIKNIKNLEKITNIFFSNRRKMINKNIKKIINKKKIDQIPNLNLNIRPSEVSPEIYYKITELFEDN